MSKNAVTITAGIATVAVLALDAYLYADRVEGNTLTQLSKAAPPVVPFSVGFLCGHLFA